MTSFSAKRISSSAKRKVVFVVFPAVKLLDLTGPMQVFADASLHGGHGYELIVASVSGGDVVTDAAISVPTVALSSLSGFPVDTLIVAGGAGTVSAAKDADLLREVQQLGAVSKRIGSVCTGTFVLAAAGLLDGRRAVTHWDSCAVLATKFPTISVEPDAIYTRDKNIWTSAGVTAGIDMTLAMITEDSGRKVALTLARSLVCYLVRPGGQSQFSGTLERQIRDGKGQFDELNAWVAENLTKNLSVEALAKRVNMSPRNFARVYKAQTGVSPAKAVEAIRIDAACQLLEESQVPLTSVAMKAGFSDEERLRRAMIRLKGVAPGAYRLRFGEIAHSP
ncbi:MAG: GlxA family transcriptional regulator [Pikeienuella sp.]